jgi:hypothetical protein
MAIDPTAADLLAVNANTSRDTSVGAVAADILAVWAKGSR